MTRFVIFLAFAILAHAFAAPGTNYGHANAEKGSIAVGVVEGGTFGEDAFSIGAGATIESKPCSIIKEIVSIFIKSTKCR